MPIKARKFRAKFKRQKKHFMYKFLILASSILAFVACQKETSKPSITLHANGIADGSVKISSITPDSVIASGQLVSGKLQTEISLEYPQLITIEIEGVETPVVFYADLSQMTVDVDGTKNPPSFKITGSSYNDSLELFGKNQTANKEFLNMLYPAYQEAMAANDSITIFVINTKADSAYQALNEYTKAFATRNGLLGTMVAMRYMYDAEYADLLPIYDAVPVIYKNAPNVVAFKDRMDKLENTQVGKRFTDITQKDTTGVDLSISSIKGKYILIDFWASWCGPCRKANPDLVQIYSEYHNLGFEIVGVSLDDDASRWKQAIVDDKLIWPQMSDLKGWQNEGAAAYAIRSIPQSIIIDDQGFIVNKNLNPDELRAFLADKL